MEFQQALDSMGTYMDITVDDLMTLAERAELLASRRDTETIGVNRVMTHPVHCIHPQTSLTEAAHLMVSKKISGLPVVGDDERLVGIITEADFLRALGVPSHQPRHNLWQTLEFLFSHLMHHGVMEAPTDPVVGHMIKNVVCVKPERDVHDVIETMKYNSVKRVVVCDNTQRVVGMVTRSDLVRLFFDSYTQSPRPG
jgi:CBS domain-containing protein